MPGHEPHPKMYFAASCEISLALTCSFNTASSTAKRKIATLSSTSLTVDLVSRQMCCIAEDIKQTSSPDWDGQPARAESNLKKKVGTVYHIL
jgi:hypothetical protein